MSETTKPVRPKLEGREKVAVEFGPVIVLFAAYALNGVLGPQLDALFGVELFEGKRGRLFTGLAVFIPAFCLAFAYSVMRTRRVAPMLAVSGVLIIGLGVLTFVFRDPRFFYVKPTIVYMLIAGGLTVGLVIRQPFLKIMFDGALDLPDHAWRTLTIRFVLFHVAAAIVNEVLWRTLTPGCTAGVDDCSGEAIWLGIKSIGFPLAYIVFVAANAPLIMKHMSDPDHPQAAGE